MSIQFYIIVAVMLYFVKKYWFKNKAKIFIIEGEIGAGKTELIKAIANTLESRGLKICTIFEPVDLWKNNGLLQLFYEDPIRYAYDFQTYAFATRIMTINNAFLNNPSADIYILERSPATDQIFMELQRNSIKPMEMNMYKTWCDIWKILIPFDFKEAQILYIKTSIHICMARVAERKRDGEIPNNIITKIASIPKNASITNGVTLEYQSKLRRANEAFFCGNYSKEFPLMPQNPFKRKIIEIGPELADGNFRDEGSERTRIITEIIKICKIV